MSDAPVLKNKRATLERIEKYISPKYFTECNLFGRLHPKSCPLKSLKYFSSQSIISYEEACKREYKDAFVGQSFGPTWSTHWFKLEIEIPKDWVDCEVRLVWDSGSEALVWKDGKPLQGLSSSNRRTYFVLTKNFDPEKEARTLLYIEMACNDVMGVGDGGLIRPPKPDKMFTLVQSEIVVFLKKVFDLLIDFEVLLDMIKSLPEDSHRGYQALYVGNRMVNMISSSQNYEEAHGLALQFFNEKNGISQPSLFAIGHCHIDTAWLWPYRETRRKCARSFSSVIQLMLDFPDFKFACSQAQQYEWIKNDYPELFERMKVKIKEGKFLPVGGTWVEMDCNIPSGESIVRQFLIGQKFFEKEFGIQCLEFWLPDTFGYSGQLPQIMKLCGISRFLTQKLSWNLVNKFPHHTFWWHGIDDSKVLAHFPPGDSYNMEGTPSELLRTVRNFQDKGRSDFSMFLFGFGDGGQGPTEEMLERLSRMKDVDGLPRLIFSNVDEFFTRVEKQSSNGLLCNWKGELFLELHNGTYTTQASVKKNNRFCEILLRNVELFSSCSRIEHKTRDCKSDKEELEKLWKLLLLDQFHDVLPGTSIHLVYEDVHQHYSEILKSGSLMLVKSLERLVRNVKTELHNKHMLQTNKLVVFNSLSWKRKECIEISKEQFSIISPDSPHQHLKDGRVLTLVRAPSVGYATVGSEGLTYDPCMIEKTENNNYWMKNGCVKALFDEGGHLLELYVQGKTRNAIAEGCHGNQLLIFDDIPLYWDAWDVMDYHLETRKPQNEVTQKVEIVQSGPLRVVLEVSHKIGDSSRMKQEIILDACCSYIKFQCTVDWSEKHKFLKVEFPLNVLSRKVTYEIQYGHLERPTHFNTTWDSAKYEVCGHKWADCSEYDFGVAVLNDCKYGWSCLGNNLRLSLLRSPKSPDEDADMGRHVFAYAIMPHCGTFQEAGVIQSSYNMNFPLLVSDSSSAGVVRAFITIEQPSIILEAFKMSECDNNKYVARFYEAYGGQATTGITFHFKVASIKCCNLLEEEMDELDINMDGSSIKLSFKPFQIISLILTCP